MSDDSRPAAATTAQSPFDDVNADLVLRTSDHVEFHVFQLILSLSSPFFQGMFTIPQPSDTPTRANDHNGTPNPSDDKQNQRSTTDSVPSTSPSIDVSEDSLTLDTLLRFLYPNTSAPPFRDLPHARNVALAASKYDMSIALDSIRDKVQTQYIASHPFHLYLIAWQMGWEDVARETAKRCLDRKLMPGEESDCDDLLLHPSAGIAYRRLEMYRDACSRALQDKINDLWIFDINEHDNEWNCKPDSEEDRVGISKQCLRRWTSEYLGNIRRAVSVSPTEDTLEDLTPVADCVNCGVDIACTIARAQPRVALLVKSVLSEVKLRFGS